MKNIILILKGFIMGIANIIPGVSGGTLALTMKSGSVLVGAIDKENQAKNVSLTMSSDSVLSLTADTYLDSLTNDDSTNSNIYSNGQYKLYVDGKEVSINSDTYDSSNITVNTTDTTTNNTSNQNNNIIYYIIGVASLLVFIGAISFIIIKSKKKKAQTN